MVLRSRGVPSSSPAVRASALLRNNSQKRPLPSVFVHGLTVRFRISGLGNHVLRCPLWDVGVGADAVELAIPVPAEACPSLVESIESWSRRAENLDRLEVDRSLTH